MAEITNSRPWHGILTATPVPLRADLSVDFDAHAAHVQWLAASGTQGVAINGSLGEYQTLTPEERARMVQVSVEAAPAGFTVMAGTGAYGTAESVRWAQQAAEAGAQCVMSLPPNAYRGDERAVLQHYREIAAVGLPIVAYNNPIDTKIDLVPTTLARLHEAGYIVAVKEFTGDVRRAYELAELAPELELMIGSDDVLLELAIAGVVGWVAGYTNAFPRTCGDLYRLALARDLDQALPLYRLLHPLLRWDSKTEFVQAIKYSMGMAGRYGGPCRAPRQLLTAAQELSVRTATAAAIAAGAK
ncbi:MAG: dihydrodipicolinate synthase family protein [Candidatus Nanopelagicales bacterium]